jgi:hypothetical protein
MFKKYVFGLYVAATLFAGALARLVAYVVATRFPTSAHPVDLADAVRAEAPHFFEGISDALVIAAIIAILVERYVQLRLATDVGEKIARKVHGYHLPPELRAALEHSDFSFVERNLTLNVVMTPTGAGDGSLLWHWTYCYEIINITDVDATFHQRAGTRIHTGHDSSTLRLLEMAHSVNDRVVYRYDAQQLEGESTRTETGTHWRHLRGVKIPPWEGGRGRQDVYEFYSVREKIVQPEELRELILDYPTIHAELIIEVPNGYAVSTSLDADGIERSHPVGRPSALQWTSDRVYLEKDRIWIKHRELPPAAPVIAPAAVVARLPASRGSNYLWNRLLGRS